MNQFMFLSTANNLATSFFPSIVTEKYFYPSQYISYSPIELKISGEIANGWEIIRPLLTTLEQDEDGFFVLSEDLFLMYGEGKTTIEAKEDYIEALIDYYQLIDSRAREGDSFSQTILQNLQQYLRPINQ